MTIKIVILLLMAIFYACYFAKMLSQRKQGIATDQLGKGKEGFVWFVEVALKCVTYLVPAVQILSIFLYQSNMSEWIRIAGIALTAAGVTAFVMSVRHMKDNWRAGVQREEKTSLVTDGIYAFSRNPAFLGFDLMYIGILATFFNGVLCVCTVIALLLFHFQIVNVEEPFLMERFGKAYLEYKKSVCRYLGRKPMKK